MKKIKLLFLLICFSCLTNTFAQKWAIELGYQYLYAKDWDKMVQTYNFSRPHLTNKQPLLVNGFSSAVVFQHSQSKKYNFGFILSYQFISSRAENENFSNSLLFNKLNWGAFIHIEQQQLFHEITLSAITSALFRRINYTAFIYDDSRSKAFGIGGEISYKIAYKLHESKRIKLYPYFQIAYSPYLYSPMTEAVINQTKNLVAKNWGTNYSFQIGCRFQFQKAVN